MKRRKAILAVSMAVALFSLPVFAMRQETPPAAQDDLKKQIGTIIVTPGNGPNLAIADFVARTLGLDATVRTFNEVLWADLDFAAVSGLIGKSLYPKSVLPDPASLKAEDWTVDPVRADYVAFGNIQ